MSKEVAKVKAFRSFLYAGDYLVSACSTCKHLVKSSQIRNHEDDNPEKYGYNNFCPRTGAYPTAIKDDNLVEFYDMKNCTHHEDK